MVVGYFRDMVSKPAIAWRTADLESLWAFLRLVPPASPPHHSTISRTRRPLSVETHHALFRCLLQELNDADLVPGKTAGIDATTLVANATVRRIVPRNTGEGCTTLLTRLAAVSGFATPTRVCRRGPICIGARRSRS